ncbi:MAG TPA: aquaporin [Gemmatimonadales bacterium]|jgi:aquaporin Z|nr:aquaporin [Gemmatimonadales bacterium]
MTGLGRRFTAELIGTFTLVYFGCAVVVSNSYPGAAFGLLGIALAHAIALGVAVTATMNISGGHLNPALTAGLLVARRIDLKVAVVHWGAQIVAAILSALALKATFPHGLARIVAYGAPSLNINVSMTQGIFLEALGTFFLMSAVYGTVVAPTSPKVGGFGVGLTLLFAIMAIGPLTGASLNPARALGPALASGQWTAHATYWIGPIVGAILAALVWEFLLMDRNKTTA